MKPPSPFVVRSLLVLLSLFALAACTTIAQPGPTATHVAPTVRPSPSAVPESIGSLGMAAG